MSHMIASGQIFLRPFEPGDAEAYRRWRADAEPMALVGLRRAPLSLDQVERRMASMAEKQGTELYVFVICLVDGDRAIGEVMLVDIDRVNGSAEVGIFIGEPAEWGKGYGTDAVRAIVAFGFDELRLERIWLEAAANNPRSIRAYEKAGFTYEATLRHDGWIAGRWVDGYIMSILRDEWQSRRA